MNVARWFGAFILLLPAVSAQVQYAGLPPDAVVIEQEPVPESAHPNRLLVLWMKSPQRNPREGTPEENPYTCPEYTRGHFYRGPTAVSLVDTAARRVINSVSVASPEESTFDIPYLIEPGHYAVPGNLIHNEGKPKLLALRDYNGDGKALEFAFFDSEACMGLETTLIGYSEKQDKAIQYLVDLVYEADGKRSRQTEQWVDYLFVKKPVKPGYWKYEIDYTGRGGTLISYEVRYDAVKERFTGKVISTGGDDIK
jgi:hypothetical protein